MARNDRLVLEVEKISVAYGQIQALRQVSLWVSQGEMVALIGSNGAGKSTFLAAVLGIQRPSTGAIRFLGREITQAPTDQIVASGIAIVPEGRGIFPQMSVLENLLLGAFHLKGDKAEHLERAFERFPILGERRHQLAGTLSGGQQQMLSIARALISKPKLLLLDEPSLGLAPIVVEDLFRIIVGLKAEGLTILLAEQNVWKALESSDRAYVFETGQIILEGDSREVENNPKVRQAYLDMAESEAWNSSSPR